LTDAPLGADHVPKLADVSFMADILRQLGVAVDWTPGTGLGEGRRYRLTRQLLAPRRLRHRAQDARELFDPEDR